MKWFKRRKAGLTEDDIRGVRNKFISLYLEPGEQIQVAPPICGYDAPISIVTLSGSTIPCFEFTKTNLAISKVLRNNYCFWLKFPSGSFPYWDVRSDEENEIIPIDFDDPIAEIPTILVKAFKNYWPFLSADNHLIAEGAPLV